MAHKIVNFSQYKRKRKFKQRGKYLYFAFILYILAAANCIAIFFTSNKTNIFGHAMLAGMFIYLAGCAMYRNSCIIAEKNTKVQSSHIRHRAKG